MSVPPARIAGRYQLLSLLGRGGMSEVYLAWDQEHACEVALKLVDAHQAEYRARFQREVAALSRLHHPHILSVIDYGCSESYCYIVMPYIREGSLRDYLAARGQLSVEEAGLILAQVASALQYLHERGLLHRDIKPGNILLARTGGAAGSEGEEPTPALHTYLADFGLVGPTDEAGHLNERLTASGCLIGTPDYLAPELAEQAPAVTSDVYALGVVLYEMLTGAVPFKGPTPLATLWQHLHAPPPSLERLNPAIPPSVAAVVLRALEKDPARRFPSAQALARAYEQALAGLALEETLRLEVVPGRQPAAALTPLSAEGAGRERRLLALGLLLALATFSCALILSSYASAPPTTGGGRQSSSGTPVTVTARPPASATPPASSGSLPSAATTPVPTPTAPVGTTRQTGGQSPAPSPSSAGAGGQRHGRPDPPGRGHGKGHGDAGQSIRAGKPHAVSSGRLPRSYKNLTI
ncbi:serine/threonine-protein kinase [Thermogemmatispora sp.]|uniref:serine/threonine-protein kinase n=1 Tax=Thermogemmatispora sp. TaxID=1968838 RepID=UPI0035E453C2